MRFETVDDIFSGHERTRIALLQTLADVSADEAAVIVSDEKWSINHITEHLAMVDVGIARICRRLVSDAKRAGKFSSGPLAVSPRFWQLTESINEAKVEAPEQVQPTGKMGVAEAIEMLQNNRPAFEAIRDDLQVLDLSEPKFPHPYFGDITATEWLIVCVGHEARHTRQIHRILKRIRQ